MKARIALGVAALMASGCTTTSLPVGGEQVAGKASMIDAMNGGLIGGDIGEDLSSRERQIALEAEYRALEYTPGGQSVPWRSEGAKHSGEVIPAQPYKVGSQDCRQYVHRVFVDGAVRHARGTACRNPDGSWTPLT
ncbi:hypothetical protein [Mesorhizobium xinjiangense]|uniref:hypothetical protein n=1 Tax=Mesorhizobium xinjiangense TaxID=2678685 RepID=UPI0012EE542C|nr:hypothetical protein [Mesorhizobium xinjiangense]